MRKFIIIFVGIFIALLISNKCLAQIGGGGVPQIAGSQIISTFDELIFPSIEDWAFRPDVFDCRYVVSNGSEQKNYSPFFEGVISRVLNQDEILLSDWNSNVAFVCKYSQETIEFINSSSQKSLILWSIIVFLLLASLIVNIFKTR